MEETTINSVGVCGAGTMGSGIAQVAAAAGYPTVLYELNSEVLEKAKTSMASNLQFLVGKGKLTAEQKEEIYSRVLFTGSISDCVADLIVEAIIEKPEAKISLFNDLAAVNGPQTIFASNTSSLSISGLAKEMRYPERFAGLHFFNPAPLM
ncbi:MAG: 3-hydroxybutyryl-CoA dehydrogenase, partial [Flaviaesturariibacter sp.]|nr:3-hydroxybutyryl-CoA dehydrogenase [Flaviaesturariibacter sp.]